MLSYVGPVSGNKDCLCQLPWDKAVGFFWENRIVELAIHILFSGSGVVYVFAKHFPAV